MSETQYDVVIVGGGVSGLMAAICLLDQGLHVAVISRGDPIACLSTGCIDLLAAGENPLKASSLLPEQHPYRLVGVEEMTASLEYFRAVAASGGLQYKGDPEHNRSIMTPIGTFKTTCLVPETMEHAPQSRDEYLHIISFEGLKDFYPGYIRSRFKSADVSVFDAGVAPTMAIAEKFDLPAFRKEFISWLKCIDISGDKVGIPAILGIESSSEAIKEIEEQIDRPLFEIPTLPPSVPGMRLFRALRRRLHRGGGHLYWGKPVASVERYGKIIEAVTIETAGRHTRVNGKAFMLATGSFVSGGLYARLEGIEEKVFGLPVHAPAARDSWFGESFFPAEHPIEGAGIVVDRSFRPTEADLENLFVCGSILAFSEVMKNGCGHGLAIATGVASAKSCGLYLKSCEADSQSCSRIA